jgi:hypothetical protein
MSDQWAWYKAAIAAKNSGKDLPPVSDGKPEVGFYYAKASRAGGRIPVRIALDKNGDIVAVTGVKAEYRIEDAAGKWSWVAGNPIERDSYVHAWEQGVWPDGTPTTAPALPSGSNLPSDPFERLMAEVDDKVADAKALIDRLAKSTTTKTDADMARNIQAALLGHVKTADAMHKAEKQPHLDACREVDDKFRFRETVKDWGARLRTVFENWMRAEEAKARAEAEKKHREELAKAQAERERIEAERKKKLADDPVAALTDDEPEMPELPLAPEPIKINAGGGVGRAAGLKTVYVGEIVDYEATIKHYRNHPDVRAVIEKLVARAVKSDKTEANIPGVKVTEDRRAA